ncbi:MAG: dihydropteroate synthase [Deltaproteobacteria bacterium]|nr:dihydropteroate synthase [Deltaproteobacteria bacterium]
MLVRRVKIDAVEEGERFARRLGLAESSQRQAAKAMARPIHLLLTELEDEDARALRALGRRPEEERARPAVFTAERGAAMICGTRWEVFSLATQAAMGDDPRLQVLADRISACLSHTERGPAHFRVGEQRLPLGERSYLMGVLNVTPDSFSDGGRFLDPAAAEAHAAAMLEAGADLLDVGGESTRPGAPPVEASEEIDRVLPVLERVVALGAPVSIDTTKVEVARAALDAGARIVNDISGLREAGMAELAAEKGASLVVMHLRATPEAMQSHTRYSDLWGEIVGSLGQAVAAAVEAGVSPDRIAVDPGIGFAKTAEQSLALIAGLGELASLGQPILVGPSRKSFIGAVTGAPVEARLPGTLAAAVLAAREGAHILRIHDVAEARQALDIADAIRAAGPAGSAYEAPGPVPGEESPA